MTEEFLYYLWQNKLFYGDMTLTDGSHFDIINIGFRNRDSGPDFINAKIKINNTIWAGNVEIHLFSSDWYNHRHDINAQYDNTILHVVWEHNTEVKHKDNSIIPTFEFKGKIPLKTYEKYLNLMTETSWIPCQSSINQIDDLEKNMWLQRLLIERLEKKSHRIELYLSQTKNNWSIVFYKLLSFNLGFKVNQVGFEMLSNSLPYNFLLKHSDNLFQLEALILGQSGLLHKDFKDEYPQKLYAEYQFLKTKYNLTPLNPSVWKFLRMHPENFPTLRLTQLASIINNSKENISEILKINNSKGFYNFFNLKSSSYWDTHYTFDKESKHKPKRLGKTAIDLLIINLIAPFLTVYYKHKNISENELPIQLLSELKAENNNIIRNWEKIGIKAKNSADSQALLELKNNYCDQKKCLQCAIGNYLLKKT